MNFVSTKVFQKLLNPDVGPPEIKRTELVTKIVFYLKTNYFLEAGH